VNPHSFFSQARFLQQIEKELFPRMIDETPSTTSSLLKTYFGPVEGLEGLLKSPSMMMNFNSHIAGPGRIGSGYLSTS